MNFLSNHYSYDLITINWHFFNRKASNKAFKSLVFYNYIGSQILIREMGYLPAAATFRCTFCDSDLRTFEMIIRINLPICSTMCVTQPDIWICIFPNLNIESFHTNELFNIDEWWVFILSMSKYLSSIILFYYFMAVV